MPETLGDHEASKMTEGALSDLANRPSGGFRPEGDTADLVFQGASLQPCIITGDLVALFSQQVNEGCAATPRGGVEVGGLLLGPAAAAGAAIVIDEAIPMVLEYQYGPSFHASESELGQIGWAALAASKDPARKLLGFYRSRTRGEPELRESDQEILRTIEGASGVECQVFLILTPQSRFLTTATVLRRETGAWASIGDVDYRNRLAPAPRNESAVPAIPAEETPQERGSEEWKAGTDQNAQPIPPAVVAPVLLAEAGAVPSLDHTSSHSFQLLAATAIVAFGVVALYALAHWPTTSSAARGVERVAPPPVRLGFSAAHENSDWQLTWNRETVSSLTPLSAILTIRDGSRERQVPLTTEDLATGTILYRPDSTDLQFTLRVNAQGRNPVEERIHALDGGRIATPPPAPKPNVRAPKDVRSPKVRSGRQSTSPSWDPLP
ncbi:MAG TPA: hypothetical protein VGH38_00100 [Bryobacteraceae bacterium]|jgi:hypothetical protein